MQALGTSSKPENKPVGSANVTIVHDFEGDGFWMAEEKGEKILPEDEWIGAVITQTNETKDNHIRIELYNSSATHHISPYRSDFTSYAPLVPPVFLNTAN